MAASTHQKLLTSDLRKKVEDKILECFKIAEKKYKTQFEMPEVRYDIKSWTGGLAYHQRWLLRFNLILLIENEKHYIENVVPHEVAHLINRRVNKVPPRKKRLMPHGKEWKDVMALLNVPADVKHTYDCSSIEKIAKAKRKLVATDRVDRIMKQVMRLTEEEQLNLASELDRSGILLIA